MVYANNQEPAAKYREQTHRDTKRNIPWQNLSTKSRSYWRKKYRQTNVYDNKKQQTEGLP